MMKESTLTTAYKHPVFDGTKKSNLKIGGRMY